MPPNSHYLIPLIVHTFIHNVYDWTGIVNDCNGLYVSTLKKRLTTISSKFFFKKQQEWRRKKGCYWTRSTSNKTASNISKRGRIVLQELADSHADSDFYCFTCSQSQVQSARLLLTENNKLSGKVNIKINACCLTIHVLAESVGNLIKYRYSDFLACYLFIENCDFRNCLIWNPVYILFLYALQRIANRSIQWSVSFNADVGHSKLKCSIPEMHAQNDLDLCQLIAIKSWIQCLNQPKHSIAIAGLIFLRFPMTTNVPFQKEL